MHYWNSILDEVLHKDETAQAFLYTNQGRLADVLDAEDTLIHGKELRDLRTYHLGDYFPNIYLTKREAETMFWVVQDFTNAQAASEMNLSSRTVEFYVKNLKLKLQCKTKKELIEKILQTDLLQRLEKEGMKVAKH